LLNNKGSFNDLINEKLMAYFEDTRSDEKECAQ
jgi:hypothetical protein